MICFLCSRARTVDPNYSSYTSYPSTSYKSLARAPTVSPSSAYSGYYSRSNVARAQDYRPKTTWYRPSRYISVGPELKNSLCLSICEIHAVFKCLQVKLSSTCHYSYCILHQTA